MKKRITHGAMAAVTAGLIGFGALVGQSVAISKPMPVDVRSGGFTRAQAESTAESAGWDPCRTTEYLIDAIVLVESAGDPACVGRAGERGLMQIKKDTWKQVSARLFGKVTSFDLAFDPALNRRVGRAYLAELHAFLQSHRRLWKSDERQLLLGAYNAGPLRLQQAGFDVRRLPASTRSYIQRATALHEHYLAEQAPVIRRLLMASAERAVNRGG